MDDLHLPENKPLLILGGIALLLLFCCCCVIVAFALLEGPLSLYLAG